MTALAVIAVIIAALSFLCFAAAFLRRSDDSGRVSEVRHEDPGTSVSVRGPVVTIRHAGSEIAVQVSGPEQYYGPLSSMSADAYTWDTAHDPLASPEDRERCIQSLREQGFRVTRADEEEGHTAFQPQEQPSEPAPVDPEFLDSLDIPSPDDGPVGELQYGPLSEPDRDLHSVMRRVSEALGAGRCDPAFAREAARVYGFSLRFRDQAKEAASNDPVLTARAKELSGLIWDNLDEAVERYGAIMHQPGGNAPKVEAPKEEPKAAASERRIDPSAMDWGALRKRRRS